MCQYESLHKGQELRVSMCVRGKGYTYRDKDKVCVPDGWVDVCREKQIFPSAWFNHLLQTRLEQREVGQLYREGVSVSVWDTQAKKSKDIKYLLTGHHALYTSNYDVIPCGWGWRREVATMSSLELIYILFSPWLSNTEQKTLTGWMLPSYIYCF